MLHKIGHYFESERGKRVKNMIIGMGASIVLMGALFKIQHWPGAGIMLIIGMSVEAFIFALQGLLPPHADYYWEKLYPNLNIAPEHDEGFAHQEALRHGETPTQQLDNMLEEANVESELIQRLGDGMRKLSDNVAALSDVTDAASATGEYTSKAQDAANALGRMTEVYGSASQAMSELAAASEDAKEYHEQVQQVSKNLAQLNAMYELELQDTNNHLKAMNQFYGSLSDAMGQMQDSVEDTRRYREGMAGLAKNLTSLNKVYGNMLSAMTGAASTVESE